MAYETITLAGGCFWCMEAIFKRLKGVDSVISGYSGGHTPNPNYKDVCTGQTGHAESVQIRFDPSIISLERLLKVFWRLHNPTTLNRQGSDLGSQYRSVVFYRDERQQQVAEKSKSKAQVLYPDEIVTEISPFMRFYKAENNHQDYYSKNPSQPYCQIVIDPKLTKLYKEFKDETKDSACSILDYNLTL